MAEYIEREAVREKISELRYLPLDYCRGVNDCSAIVESIPAADVATVVHGEWVVCGDGDNVPWMCSHCGKTTAHKYKVMYGNYCPNCGAKMDAEARKKPLI